MNIDYISDLHLDFYVPSKGGGADYRERTRAFLAGLLPELCADVLVIAGDISHYNRQSYGNSYCYLNKLEDVRTSVCLFGHCHEQKVYKQGEIKCAWLSR